MLRQVIDRLKEKACPPLVDVQGAFALASLTAPPARTVGYVALGRETAGPNQRMSGTQQRITRQAAVIVCHGNKRDARGEAAAIDVEDLCGPVIAALLGWSPAKDHDVFTFVGSEPRSFEQYVLAHQLVFATETFITGGQE